MCTYTKGASLSIDPNSLSPTKALETIGHALQAQYERWQPRARYKQSLDPTSDEVRQKNYNSRYLRRQKSEAPFLFMFIIRLLENEKILNSRYVCCNALS